MEQLTAPAVAPAPAVGPPLARQRNLILATLLTLAVVGWVVVVDQSGSGAMGHDMAMAGPDLTMGRSAPLFFLMWVAMMIAMMFPAAAPMILLYARTQQREPLNTSLFTASYLALWVAFGLVAFGLGVATEVLVERSDWAADNWARAGGVLLVLAGVYQLSQLKDYCLTRCRTPLSFLMHSWKPGPAGAVRMGLHHGMFCMGCCWLLFLVLVPLGVMNVAPMLAVAAVVFAEKAMPWGRGAARLAAAGLAGYGVLVLVAPGLLPTVA